MLNNLHYSVWLNGNLSYLIIDSNISKLINLSYLISYNFHKFINAKRPLIPFCNILSLKNFIKFMLFIFL